MSIMLLSSATVGMKMNRPHPFILREVRWNDEVAVDIRAARPQVVSSRHFHDQVRLAQMPSVGEFWQLRHLRGVALRHAVLHPLSDRRNLAVGEPALIGELAVTMGRMPGRHIS